MNRMDKPAGLRGAPTRARVPARVWSTRRVIRTAVVPALTACIGCASYSNQAIPSATLHSFALGLDTVEIVSRELGKPRYQWEVQGFEGGNEHIWSYLYYPLQPITGNKIKSGNLTFDDQGSLIRYRVISYLPEDQPKYPPSGLSRLQPGTTTMADVEELFGTPSSRWLVPFRGRDWEVWGYLWGRGPTFVEAEMTFNRQGVLFDYLLNPERKVEMF